MIKKILKLILIISLILTFIKGSEESFAGALIAKDNPIELGQVHWYRSLAEALPIAQKEKKPIFLLFQEVPGCLTCQQYGYRVLSHPFVVEALETHFIPVAIFNNRKGEDSKTLTFFGEPAWNNPVVRIITSERKDLVPRLSGNYTLKGVVENIILALEKSHVTIPDYLSLLNTEMQTLSRGTEKSVLAMPCFWAGEGTLGALKGVIYTKPGFLDGYEVVEVEYDPVVISYTDLLVKAHATQMAKRVFTYTENQYLKAKNVVGQAAQFTKLNMRPDHNPKYYLHQTIMKFLPMTEFQATKINSAISAGINPQIYLSPRQNALLNIIYRFPDAGWEEFFDYENFLKNWDETLKRARQL